MQEFAASFVDKKALVFQLWFEPDEMAGYDQIELWRSTTSEAGPYRELTGDSWLAPALTVKKPMGPISGKTLELLVGTTPLTITFSGDDPLNITEVSAQILAASLGLLTTDVDMSGRSLTLMTSDVGSKARLEVTGGTAAPLLGLSTLPPSNCAYGTDARLRLRPGVKSYRFEDAWGKVGYFYRARLRQSAYSVVSEFFQLSPKSNRAVTPDKLVAGWVRLVDFQGRPVANRSIMISATDTIHSLSIGDFVVDYSDQQLRTDDQGYCSLLMLRGVPVTVGIAGTALVRDVTPPIDPAVESFNLFDPAVSSDDAFAVQVPDINLAERR